MSSEQARFPWAAGSQCDGGNFDQESLEPMGFRVWSFRSVRDSGYVPLSKTTALVGREQSGKTTLLEALSGLDPRRPAPFSARHDWPRGQRPRPSGDQIVCAAKLRFRRSLRDELVNAGLIDPEAAGVHVGRSFSNDFLVSVLNSEGFHGRLPSHTEDWGPGEPQLQGEVLKRMPAFTHAHSHSMLPEKFPAGAVTRLLWDPKEAPPDSDDMEPYPDDSGVPALVSLARMGFREGEEPSAWIRRVNDRLGQFTLSQTLRLSDDRGLIRVLVQQGNGWYPFGNLPLARRYIMTLDLRIAAIHGAGEAAPVLLLDAPGKAFKGGLKRQLRGSLARYTAAGIHVIYTARMPFHIELQHPEQVLVLAPDDAVRDTLCDAPFDAGEMTLQAALGMQGRSSFSIDDVNLLVEGPTDAGILRSLSTLFAAEGWPTLAKDLNIVSAGGAFEVASVAAFLARQGLGVVALFDSDAAGLAGMHQLEQDSAKEPLRRPIFSLHLGEAAHLEVDGATIEDLFPALEYLGAAESIAGEPERRLLGDLEERIKKDDTTHAARLIRKAYEARGWRFPKVQVAEALQRRILATKTANDLDPDFRASIRSLFERINAGIEAVQAHSGRKGTQRDESRPCADPRKS